MKQDQSLPFNFYQSHPTKLSFNNESNYQQNSPKFNSNYPQIQIQTHNNHHPHYSDTLAFDEFLERNGVRGYRAGQTKNKNENSMKVQLVNKASEHQNNEGFNGRKMQSSQEGQKIEGFKSYDYSKASKASIKQEQLDNFIYRLIAIASCHIHLNQRCAINELIMFVKISKIQQLVNILNKHIVNGVLGKVFNEVKNVGNKQDIVKIVEKNGIGRYHGIRHVISRGSSFGQNNMYFDGNGLNEGDQRINKQINILKGEQILNKDLGFQNVFEFNTKKQHKAKKKINKLQPNNLQPYYSATSMNNHNQNEEEIDIYLKLERQAQQNNQQQHQQHQKNQQYQQRQQQTFQYQTPQQNNTHQQQFNHKSPSQNQYNNLTFQTLLRVQQPPFKSDGRDFFQRFQESERKYHLNPDVLKTSEPDYNDHPNGFINNVLNKELPIEQAAQIQINKFKTLPMQKHDNFQNGKIVYIVQQNSNKIIPNAFPSNQLANYHQAERNRRKSDLASYHNGNVINSNTKQQAMLSEYFPENSKMPLICSLNCVEEQNVDYKRPRSMTYSVGNNSTNDPSIKNNQTSQNTIKMPAKIIQSFNPDYQTTPSKQRQINIHQSPQSSQPFPSSYKIKQRFMHPQINPQIKFQINNFQPQTNKIRSLSSDCRFFYQNPIIPSSTLVNSNFPAHVTPSMTRPHMIINKQRQQNLPFQNALNHYQMPVSNQIPIPINQRQNLNSQKLEGNKIHKSPKGIQVCSPRARGNMKKQRRGQYL